MWKYFNYNSDFHKAAINSIQNLILQKIENSVYAQKKVITGIHRLLLYGEELYWKGRGKSLPQACKQIKDN